ncbi:MAG: hypothetical protein LBQ22_00765 [Bacteroidales bacterium]|jgi:hypothetical protein|nr:hypothetical protein [Bacteroidales bacterium]
METKEKNNKGFSLKKAYNDFVKNKVRFNKEQSRQITPSYMFEQYYHRKNVLSQLVDLCDILRDETDFIFLVFSEYIEKNPDYFRNSPKQIRVIFELFKCFTTFASYDETIREWCEHKEKEMSILEERDVHDMDINEITSNKKILDILSGKGLL